jgi:hypothetical protein
MSREKIYQEPFKTRHPHDVKLKESTHEKAKFLQLVKRASTLDDIINQALDSLQREMQSENERLVKV